MKILKLHGWSFYISLHRSVGRSVGQKKCQKTVKNCQKRDFGKTNDCTSVQQGFKIMLECKFVCQQQKKTSSFVLGSCIKLENVLYAPIQSGFLTIHTRSFLWPQLFKCKMRFTFSLLSFNLTNKIWMMDFINKCKIQDSKLSRLIITTVYLNDRNSDTLTTQEMTMLSNVLRKLSTCFFSHLKWKLYTLVPI